MSGLSVSGMRELLLLGVVLVAAYLVVLLVRLRRRSTPVVRDSSKTFSWTSVEPGRIEPLSINSEVPDQDFAGHMAQSAINLEVHRLRHETTQLRAEVLSLREEIRQVKATRNVSPVYSEAISLANRGELPAGIAARCGISIGEAELVAALARGESGTEADGDFESHQKEP